jgi:conjugative relaxase-like TrwC/TraI family protein
MSAGDNDRRKFGWRLRRAGSARCPHRVALNAQSFSPVILHSQITLLSPHLLPSQTKRTAPLTFTDIRLQSVNPKKAFGTLAQGAILVVVGLGSPVETSTGAGLLAGILSFRTVLAVLTISRLGRWSIRYYNDTATTAKQAGLDRQAANGGLGEYYSEADTRIPTWIITGDQTVVAGLCGLDGAALAGGAVDTAVAAAWLDDGIAPNGQRGRTFTTRSVHGFDLTFAAPKSVSLVRALTGEVAEKVLAAAHEKAIQAAMAYLHQHAGYTRIHDPDTGMKDLQRLPGLVGMAYQHETSRCGDPHLHTHVIVPNRQPRADGVLVSLDSKSLYHEAKAAGMIYQATLRHELHVERGFEWAPVDPHSGMAEIAGITRDHHCLVAAFHPPPRMGPRQTGRRRRGTHRGTVGGCAEGHPPDQTRSPGVGGPQGAVARG